MENKTQKKNATANVTNQDLPVFKVLASSKNEQKEEGNLQDKVETERRDAYVEPKTRDILRKLLQADSKGEILPIFDPQTGYVYRLAGSDLESSEINNISLEFLRKLTRLDLLQKKFYDSASACPSCSSTLVTLHTLCPKCKSHNIVKTSLTEHIPCGNIDQKEQYVENRCPKCGELLVNGQFRNMGRWYVCNDCSERFENPELNLFCRSCSKKFTVREAQLLEVPKFLLNPVRKKEIRQNVESLEEIRMLLAELGFKIEIPGTATGQKSGMYHHFSLIAKKEVNRQEIVVALDHAISEAEVQPQPLIMYVYKISEVKIDIPIFVAAPRLSKDAQKIAEANGILIIDEQSDRKEIGQYIKEEIEKRTQQKTPNDKTQKEEKTSFFNKIKIRKT